jgi:thiopurine S-methyltransferase
VDPTFWQEKWRENQLRWHRGEVEPHLERYVERLAPGGAGSVLVPLCGKSADIRWLAARGHRVVGIDVVEDAAIQLFGEAGMEPVIERAGAATRYRGGGIEFLVADVFAVRPADVGPIDGIWDRAAMVALPDAQRPRYAKKLAELAPSARILIQTIEYDISVMDGPPFSVTAAELRELFAGAAIEQLERADVIDQREGRRWAEKGHRHWFVAAHLIEGLRSTLSTN